MSHAERERDRLFAWITTGEMDHNSNGHPLWGGRLHDWLGHWRQLLCVPPSYGALYREPWLLLTTWSPS